MPDFSTETIKQVAIHHVGNKATEEGYILSTAIMPTNEQIGTTLLQYFVSPFKGEEYYNLYGDESLEMNDIYRYARAVFENPECMCDVSQDIAKKLYEASTYPNIKGGDLFVVYFDGCSINGEETQAIGVFKAENKDPFIKVVYDEEQWSRLEGDTSATAKFKVEIDKGINIKKLDKGAIIFNIEEENGYVVSVVDATNRGTDAAYWKDTFLGIRQREDEYFNTHEVMKAYKKFVTEVIPEEFPDATRADCADRLNLGANFFKQNESFDMQQFEEQVLVQSEVIDKFNEYKEQYEDEHAIQIPEQFDISESAVKKQARAYKSVIKLDKNFHIYVHGNRELIEQGVDEKGKFYKVYYNEET